MSSLDHRTITAIAVGGDHTLAIAEGGGIANLGTLSITNNLITNNQAIGFDQTVDRVAKSLLPLYRLAADRSLMGPQSIAQSTTRN